MNFKNKTFKITTIAIFILILSGYLVFSHGGYKEYSSDESFNVLMSVLLDTVKNKGELALSENEINALGSSYFKEGLTKGSLTIRGLNMNIKEDEVTTLIPVKFKSFPILLSTKGTFSIDNKEVVYTPEFFKVGKITIPRGTILNYISKNFNDKLKVEGEYIVINRSILPDDIDSFKFANGKLFLVAKEETKQMLAKTNESIKKIQEQAKAGSKDNSNANKGTNSGIDYKNSGNKVGNETKNSNPKDNNSKQDTRQSLAQIAGELGSLQGSASTSKEKQMISIMSSTANTLQSNPSYNFWGDVKRVMSIYDTLTPKEKEKFKSKVFSGVDLNNAMEIKDDYGM